MASTITKKWQVSIPTEVRKKLGLKPGDKIEFTVEGDKIIGIPVTEIPKSQAYFWSKEWQKLEKKAEEDIENENTREFDNPDEAIDWLKRK